MVYVGEENLGRYVASGAVGDTCTRYFDASGNYMKTELHDRTIGISIDQLRNAKNLYIVASGLGKADAVLAFIRKGKVSNLFIDEELAKLMVQKLIQ